MNDASSLPSNESDILVIRRGPGGNCSSVGSALDLLFLSGVVGGAALVAVGSLLEKVRGASTSPPCDEDVGESGDGAKPESEPADAG
jgi:hypothetical protein